MSLGGTIDLGSNEGKAPLRNSSLMDQGKGCLSFTKLVLKVSFRFYYQIIVSIEASLKHA